jgi:hypothetical protein
MPMRSPNAAEAIVEVPTRSRGPDALVGHQFDFLTHEGERVPEGERERVLHVDEELMRQRLVQAEVLRHQLERVERSRSQEQQFRGIARDHAEQEEVEDDDEGQSQQRLRHLAEDVPARPQPGLSSRLPVRSCSLDVLV